jgi:C-terminal processing protease CtpA/Prc
MFPDGSPFEGVGIRPDLEVLPSVDDLRAGRDVVLEAAKQRLLATEKR